MSKNSSVANPRARLKRFGRLWRGPALWRSPAVFGSIVGAPAPNNPGRRSWCESTQSANTSPTASATIAVITYRPTRIGPGPNAIQVLASTIGFITGDASRKDTPTETGSPLAYRRRVTGTTPHSQTGNTNPSTVPAAAA